MSNWRPIDALRPGHVWLCDATQKLGDVARSKVIDVLMGSAVTGAVGLLGAAVTFCFTHGHCAMFDYRLPEIGLVIALLLGIGWAVLALPRVNGSRTIGFVVGTLVLLAVVRGRDGFPRG